VGKLDEECRLCHCSFKVKAIYAVDSKPRGSLWSHNRCTGWASLFPWGNRGLVCSILFRCFPVFWERGVQIKIPKPISNLTWQGL
jgi:hypothetical protein